jgi:hypothetical protein
MAKVQTLAGLTHRFNELVMQDFDEHLTGCQALLHFSAQGAHLDGVNEGLNHWDSDVSLDQGHPHLAQGISNIVLSEAAAARKGVNRAGQALGQTVEHGISFVAADYRPTTGPASRAAVPVQSSGGLSGISACTRFYRSFFISSLARYWRDQCVRTPVTAHPRPSR